MNKKSYKKIIRLYKSGIPATKISKLYSCKNGKIYSILKHNGVNIRSKGGTKKIYNDGWSNEFVRLYIQGMSIQDIAKKLGVGFGTVQRGLYKKKIILRRNGNRKRTIKMPRSIDKLGYLAGILDGEGNIQIRKTKIINNKSSIACKLAIYNTNKNIMKWLEKNVGGKVRWDNKRAIIEKWKPIGIWELYRASDVSYFLSKIKKYLIIKKDTANTVLAILKKGRVR